MSYQVVDKTVIMAVPEVYLRELAAMLRPLAAGVGSLPLDEARKIVGKAGRLAQIVAEARPFTSAMWTAFQEAWSADKKGIREAPPHEAARHRFAWAAKWLLQLIAADNEIFPLRTLVTHLPPVVATTMDVIMQFDASPWGQEPLSNTVASSRNTGCTSGKPLKLPSCRYALVSRTTDLLGITCLPHVLHHMGKVV